LAPKNSNQKKKFNLFSLFYDPNKDGRGVDKSEINAPRNLKLFFKMYGRNITRLLYINLMIILGNFPLLFGLFALSGNVSHHSFAPVSRFFPILYGTLKLGGGSPVTAALYGVHGVQSAIAVNSTASYVLYTLTALVFFTFGLVNVGTTYILRNLVKGEPIFLWHDFWYAIKRNLRQGIIIGIIDLFLLIALSYDIVFFYFNLGDTMFNIMFYMSLFLAVIYFMMRFYMYIILVTFDLSIFKILKNSFIFSLLGIKRNILAAIGIVLLIAFTYTFLIFLFPVGVTILLVAIFSHGAFMAAYAAFPKIKQIMIDPYYEEHPEERKDTGSDEEPIFTDTI